jgi:hypothetical protein
MIRLLPAIERILLTLWVGSLWVTGFIVAPLLFAQLDDRAIAGSIAGSLFTITALIGLVCGSVLLMTNTYRHGRFNWRAWVILAMLLLVAAGQFVLTPMISELRVQGLSDTARFGQLHGLAGLLFVVTSVLGLLLVAAARPARNY